MYNVAEFLMNDKDNSGKVSVEEVMQILFLRYGRQLLDSQLEEMFGTSDTNSGAQELTLSECVLGRFQHSFTVVDTLSSFLTSLHTSQLKQLRMRAASRLVKAPPVGSSQRK